MALTTASQLITIATGKKIRVVGQGANAAAADAELAAKLVVTPGTPVVGSHKISNTQPAELPAHALTPFEDVTFTLSRGGILSTWTVNNVSTAYAAANRPGYVDVTNADIQALAAAHTDFNGNGGFSIVEGKYSS